ncbi:Glycogen synthase [Bosea sp. LC85]|uniref:glycosyltransferase n=1 Tax=Bosea sp. LC85 TaxID=1502851 RepID=UPI0004E3AC6B|nr:glycosyltransferase [Bosea sp. LC85]KFC66777.1 Glycogen synthase [Bosea sp. LC85]
MQLRTAHIGAYMIRVALVCISPLRHDSRVLRHAALLAGAGYDVRIFAQAPLPDSPPTPVTVLRGPGSDWRVRFGMVFRQAPATLLPASADSLYWASSIKLAARRDLLKYRPDLVIANDWRSLPVAFAARRASGARIIYDSHEFAPEEFSDSWRWRALARRHVMRVEDRYIRKADAIVTVSPGIAEALAERYGLSERPVVISNTPSWQATAFRPTGSPVTVLYHGAVVPRRGLETLIASLPLWPADYRLIIRGPTQGQFDQHLRGLAGHLGDRIAFEPAVAPHQVVATAAQADIGIFLLSNSTTHARFALPNKVFEYMQAGLMLVSSDLPEIRKHVESTGCGLLLPQDAPKAIAACLAGLDRDRIDACKRASLEAARRVNFEAESTKLLTIVEHLCQSTA